LVSRIWAHASGDTLDVWACFCSLFVPKRTLLGSFLNCSSGCGSATLRYPIAFITSRTSVQVGNGLAFFLLYSSITIRNSNCSSDICPSSADFLSSLLRLPGPRRRSSPKRLSTTFCLRSFPLRCSVKCSSSIYLYKPCSFYFVCF
jgi:hypothetical protein